MAIVQERTMNKAIRFSNPGTTETCIAELPIGEPGPGEVLVRMLYSGICHTDYASCTGGLGVSIPEGQVGGHEGIGEVIEQGPGVTLPAIGSKVGIKWAASVCLNCKNCLMGAESECPSLKISGTFHPGTFQQYLLASAVCATPIPEGIDLAGAAPLMCAGASVYAGLKRAQTKLGDWVLIMGAGGGLGHLAIQYAKAMGAGVVAMDIGSKEEFCKELGADIFVDFTKFGKDEEVAEEVKRLVPGGMNVVLCCASSKRAYLQASMFLGARGKLVCLGIPERARERTALFELGPIILNELTVIGIKSGSRQEAKESLDIAARGLVKTHYQLRPMDTLTEAFAEMEEGGINGRIVLDLR